MDVKDLNKAQLLLLAILLSFVTSIVTGITTVTLMERAPSSVTTPINRIIKQTVEKIEQVEGKTVVQTVIVKEEDLVVDAIAKNKSAIFAISKDVIDEEGKTVEWAMGVGFAINSDGVIVADSSMVFGKGAYYVKNGNGKWKAEFVSSSEKGLSFLKIGAPLDEKSKLAFEVPALGDIEKMKAGQKILILGTTISSFIFEGDKDLKINVTKANGGGLVMNLEGEALGIALSEEDTSFVPIDVIIDALKSTKPIETAATL